MTVYTTGITSVFWSGVNALKYAVRRVSSNAYACFTKTGMFTLESISLQDTSSISNQPTDGDQT